MIADYTGYTAVHLCRVAGSGPIWQATPRSSEMDFH